MAIEHTYSFRNHQRGAATILMALIMLFSITVISIFTARTTITEQKILGNEFRSRQAFEAAEAGLQFGISYFNNGGADHSSPSDGTDTFTATNIDGTEYSEPGQPSYHVAFCDPDIATHTPPLCIDERNDSDDDDPATNTIISTCEAPPDNSIALVYACGWSDDRTASRTISQIVRFKQALPNLPKSPFTSKGDINITGTFVVRNNFTNTTVWTGGNVDNRTAQGRRRGRLFTEIRVDDIPNTTSTNTNNRRIVKGLDVISNDANLSNASSDVYFRNFFGKSKGNVRRNADLVINDGDAIPSPANSLNKLIYATDDITVNDELGSEEQPIILVVNGTLTLAGDAVIYGTVYAIDVRTRNDATINGAMMVENSITINTNDDLTINYDIDTLNATRKTGMTGAVSGSWHDW